jgi:hypothetical protein
MKRNSPENEHKCIEEAHEFVYLSFISFRTSFYEPNITNIQKKIGIVSTNYL